MSAKLEKRAKEAREDAGEGEEGPLADCDLVKLAGEVEGVA